VLPEALHGLDHHVEDRGGDDDAPDHVEAQEHQGVLHRADAAREAVHRGVDHLEDLGREDLVPGDDLGDLVGVGVGVLHQTAHFVQNLGQGGQVLDGQDLALD